MKTLWSTFVGTKTLIIAKLNRNPLAFHKKGILIQSATMRENILQSIVALVFKTINATMGYLRLADSTRVAKRLF